MSRKPWPIVLLALIHFLEPLFKIAFYCAWWQMMPGKLLTYLQYQSSPLEIFLFLGAFPLAGFAILSVKRWSLPVFFLIQVVTIAGHIYYHLVAPKAFPIYLIATMTILNLAVVSYFVLPAVRIAYLDPSVRWWEAKPRFLVDWKGKILQGKGSHDAAISNISEGGVFLAVAKSAKLQIEETVQVEFSFLNTEFNLPGRIRHFSAGAAAPKYGIQFLDLNAEQTKSLRRCTRALKALDFEEQGRQDSLDSFRSWAGTLLRTGKGLVPEVKQLPAKKSQITVGTEKKSA